MRSRLFLGMAGLLVVLAFVFGGMVMASACHKLLTPNLDFCFTIWVWLWFAPFWWLCASTLPNEHIEHPIATYIGLLPFLLLIHVSTHYFQAGNPWRLPVLAVAFPLYLAASEWAQMLFLKPRQ